MTHKETLMSMSAELSTTLPNFEASFMLFAYPSEFGNYKYNGMSFFDVYCFHQSRSGMYNFSIVDEEFGPDGLIAPPMPHDIFMELTTHAVAMNARSGTFAQFKKHPREIIIFSSDKKPHDVFYEIEIKEHLESNEFTVEYYPADEKIITLFKRYHETNGRHHPLEEMFMHIMSRF